MYRTSFTPQRSHNLYRPDQCQDTCTLLFAPLTLWICVSVILRYGYYGDCHMVIGPSTSRLFKSSSLFVKQVEVRDSDKKGLVQLHGFSHKPELSSETHWNVSNYVIIGAYSRKGFYLWLNRGSSFRLRWTAEPSSSLKQLQVSIIKGEQRQEILPPTSTSSVDARSTNKATDGRGAEYAIEEDDRYYVDILNLNPGSTIMVMNLNVSSKMYDVTKAKSMCTTINGSCNINLGFPDTQFVVVTTPNNGDIGGWYIELSFIARVVTYIGILACVAIIIYFMSKYLMDCDNGRRDEEVPLVREISESDPLMPDKMFGLPYGTNEEDLESNTSSSSEDLYDGKICVICYDMPRNCFFVPCGHCATCYECAQRIMDEDGKSCPICRRLIRKVRKLIIP